MTRTLGVEQRVEDALYEVLDPDLGVNVMDLGFVRDITVVEGRADITMTLTSPACPLTPIMEDQIRTALVEDGRIVDDFRVVWEWSPRWTPAAISESGREQLSAIGFSF